MEYLEEAQARHRRDLRDLQGRITNKKKNATKKTRKGVLDECAAMERALHETHEAELRALRGEAEGAVEEVEEAEKAETDDKVAVDAVNDIVAARLADTRLDTHTVAAPPPAKRNRQRERLARRAAAAAADQAAAAAEAATLVDHGAVERALLAPLIARSGRVVHEIRADGHCLFAAVADQLTAVGKGVDEAAASTPAEVTDGVHPVEPYRRVRWAAVRYMAQHPDDFAPFVVAEDGDAPGDAFTAHLARIRDTTAWGGALELRALASAYHVDICVLHDGRSELVQPAGTDDTAGADTADKTSADDTKRPTLWLVYFRHGFGLGEHYNSLRTTHA